MSMLVWLGGNLYYRCVHIRENRSVDAYLWTILQGKWDVIHMIDPVMENYEEWNN